jgi:hypothetical protein
LSYIPIQILEWAWRFVTSVYILHLRCRSGLRKPRERRRKDAPENGPEIRIAGYCKSGHVALSDGTRGGVDFVNEDGVQAFANDKQVLTTRIDLKKSGIAYLNDIAWSEGSGRGVDAG